MIDLVKKTIIKKLKDLNLSGITIMDGSLQKEVVQQETKNALFVESIDSVSIKVIDLEEYIVFGLETIVDFVGDISGFELQVDGKNTGCIVSSYDPINGIIVVDKEITEKLFKYATTISLAELSTEEEINRVEVSAVSTMVSAKNKNISYKTRRYDMMMFVHDDENGDLTNYYVDSIQSALSRDFPLLNSSGQATKCIVYISDSCRFDILQYNKTNRVMRGTILLKTIIN
jgi:hypothetical protein